MKRKQKKLMLVCIMCAFTVTSISIIPLETHADTCVEMEEKGLLLYQQFQKGKACKDSKIGEGMTDCLFKAGDTEILLVGAFRKGTTERKSGFSGSGFNVLSVGPDVRVRIFTDGNFGLLVKVEGKDNQSEIGCVYNEAYITLDSQVLNPRELDKIKYGPTPQSGMANVRIKDVQKSLHILGYSPGKIDGILGPQTRAALEAYKQDKHLQNNLPEEAVIKLIIGGAILKGLTELEKMGEEMWEPKSQLR